MLTEVREKHMFMFKLDIFWKFDPTAWMFDIIPESRHVVTRIVGVDKTFDNHQSGPNRVCNYLLVYYRWTHNSVCSGVSIFSAWTLPSHKVW